MKKKIYAANQLAEKNKKVQLKNIFTFFLFFTSALVSAQNPSLLKSPIPGASGRGIQKIVTTTSGKTFFNTIDNNNHFSDLWGLWVTDGTQAGTAKLILNSPGYTNTNTKEATLLTPLGNDKIIFAGDNERGYGELWVSDGTEQGTIPLEIFATAFSGGALTNIISLGNIAIFSAYANGAHSQLGKTDGTKDGTTVIYDFGADPANPNSVGYFKTIGNLVYFELTNGITHHSEIWRTDGTTIGTYRVKDLGPDYGFASDFMSFKNNIYFITVSSTYGDYIWKSDGTNAGTVPLKQISTAFNSDNLFPSYAATSNLLCFTANDGINGKELWKTDGTAAGTSIAGETISGSGSSNPASLVSLNGSVYYVANTIYFGNETCLFNGTNVYVLKDIFPGGTGSNPSNLTIQNNTFLFSASGSAAVGNELWVSDGGTNSTFEIANINPVNNLSSNPSSITIKGNEAYFVASFDANGDGIDDPCIYKYSVPQKIWTGSVSTDSRDGNNWFPAGVPAQTDNVLLPINAANAFSNPFLFCNDFINNGATVTVGTGLVLINGDFYNEGIIDNSTPGVFGVVGNMTRYHSIGSPGVFLGQFTASNNVIMNLTADTKFNALRIEGSDTIYLGNYQLTVDNYPIYIPMYITNGSGKLFLPVGASPVTFSLVNPVTITNNGAPDYFGVSVSNGILKAGTMGDSIKTEAVNKTWDIVKRNGGAANVTITLQWSAADELAGFVRSNVYLNHYTSGAWDSGTPGIASGSGPFTFSRSGITSLSPFSISSSTSVLPVTLISFTANKINRAIQLRWQASSEKNFSFFDIERSTDGIIFSNFGEVTTSFNSSSTKNYSYTDNAPNAGTNFYRLKMVDADGKFTYSKTIAIRFDGNNTILQIFPNPAKDILHVQVTGSNANAMLQVIDLSGRKVTEKRVNVDGTTSVSIDISGLPKGMYNLFLKINSKTEQRKFVKD